MCIDMASHMYVGCMKCYCFHKIFCSLRLHLYRLNILVATCCVASFTFLYASLCEGCTDFNSEVVSLEFGKKILPRNMFTYERILDRSIMPI